ncbi:MAG: thioredoxin domain-containing protein [Alphaproteobacteria bacterium]|nr:thioredoxin domain-containing protein [Alphaproteobacteria bacterium]
MRSVFCILAIVSIIVMPCIASSSSEPSPAQTTLSKKLFVMPDTYKKYTLSFGNPKAPIQIHNFFSFSCASCLMFHKHHFPMILDQFIKSGKVYWTLVPYVMDVDTLYVMATVSACPDDVKLHAYETIMDSALNWTDEDNKEKIIQNLKECGISADVIQNTLSEVNYEVVLRDSFDFQEYVQIDGTPTLFINGKEIPGIPGSKKLAHIITDMLNSNNGGSQ